MFGGGEANYNISWTGLSPNIFREHMAPLFSDLREERLVIAQYIVLMSTINSEKDSPLGQTVLPPEPFPFFENPRFSPHPLHASCASSISEGAFVVGQPVGPEE